MLIALLVIAGLAIVTLLVMYLLLRRSMRKEVGCLRAELSSVLSAGKRVQGSRGSQPLDEIDHQAGGKGLHALTPEALGEIAASLSVSLGRDVQISAAADGPASNGAHRSWAQQGCVAIQNSHDLSLVKQAGTRPPVSGRRHVA
jgi:hypothetical protein